MKVPEFRTVEQFCSVDEPFNFLKYRLPKWPKICLFY